MSVTRKKLRSTTFRQVFGAHAGIAPNGGVTRCWRIAGSGVTGTPERARFTRMVVDMLAAIGMKLDRAVSMGMVNADSHSLKVRFLDGGLTAETGSYIGGQRGAYVTGPEGGPARRARATPEGSCRVLRRARHPEGHPLRGARRGGEDHV